jgi:AcrR family transcriptional regulator
MDAKTQKSEMTRAAIIGAGIDLAAAEGLEAITLQAVADRIGFPRAACSRASVRARPCRRP